MSTVAPDCDNRPIARNTSCIAGAWPSISVVTPDTVSTGVCADDSAMARRMRATA
jgi:hypothetical protein